MIIIVHLKAIHDVNMQTKRKYSRKRSSWWVL